MKALACFLSAVLIVAGVLVASAHPPTSYPAARAPLSIAGTEIFYSHGAACHGSDGRGHGPAAAALRHGAPDLTLISRRNGGVFPRSRVKAIIAGDEQSPSAHGSREMPVWGPIFHQPDWDLDLGEVRLENVTTFVESLQQK